MLLLPRNFPGSSVKATGQGNRSRRPLAPNTVMSLSLPLAHEARHCTRACVLKMTCGRSSQLSTEELESVHHSHGPAHASANQPTKTTTRTSHAHMQTLGPDQLLCPPWHHITAPKKQSPSDTAIEAIAQTLSPTTPASGHDRSEHHDTRHHQARFAQPSLEWIRQKLFCCRSPDPVCASRPAKKHGRLFCHGVAAKRHH